MNFCCSASSLWYFIKNTLETVRIAYVLMMGIQIHIEMRGTVGRERRPERERGSRGRHSILRHPHFLVRQTWAGNEKQEMGQNAVQFYHDPTGSPIYGLHPVSFP